MSDAIRQAAEALAKECHETTMRHYYTDAASSEDLIPGIERAMRKLVDEATPSAFKCKAQRTADPPQDCDWPTCGCDPHADKVIESLEESGHLVVPNAPIAGEEELVDKMTREWYGNVSRKYSLRATISSSQDILPIIRAYVAERVMEAVEAEREACAKTCEESQLNHGSGWSHGTVCANLANEIRARSAEAKR